MNLVVLDQVLTGEEKETSNQHLSSQGLPVFAVNVQLRISHDFRVGIVTKKNLHKIALWLWRTRWAKPTTSAQSCSVDVELYHVPQELC